MRSKTEGSQLSLLHRTRKQKIIKEKNKNNISGD